MHYDVYLEIGKKKVFACAIDWPGWCRSGKDETSALEALLLYSPRYERVMETTNLGFVIPDQAEELNITERVKGNLTTDFGAPDIQIASDQEPVQLETVERYRIMMNACWVAFDEAVQKAEGKELRRGPRGGGRELTKIIEHVAGGAMGHVYALGWRVKIDGDKPAGEQLETIRCQIEEAMVAAVEGKLPTEGPRGGKKWPLRYYVRRAAWHVLDHAWEIEDRII